MKEKTQGSQALPLAQYNFAAVDWAKVVFAFGIVALHASPLASISEVWDYGVTQYLTRIGVPFFLVCNGYFLFAPGGTVGQTAARARAQVKKLLTLYLLWSALYSPILIYSVIRSKNPLKTVLGLVRRFLFVGSYSHLWYLLGAAVAIALLVWLRSRNWGWGKIAALAGVLYLLGLSYDAYYAPLRALPIWNQPLVYWPVKLFFTVFVTTRNGLFFGLPFVALGAWLAGCKRLPRRSACLSGFAAAMLAGAGEAFLLRGAHWPRKEGVDMYFFLIPAVAFLFCWLLQLPKTSPTGGTRTLRKFSTLVYLIHPWLLFLYTPLTKRLFAPGTFPRHSLCRYLVVSALAALLAVLVLRLAQYPRFAWLKRFY